MEFFSAAISVSVPRNLQLEGLGVLGDDLGGLGELAGGLELAVGVDDLGPPLPLGLGLLGDGPDHVLGQVHLLHLHELDLDAPGVGVLFDDLLESGVQLVALREEVVERDLAEDAAQGRLGELGGGVEVILDVDDALERVDDPEVEDGVDLHRDVVLGDDVLGRDVHRDEPQADLHDAVDRGEDQDDPGALGLGQDPAEPEDDPALVLPQDLDGVQDVKDDDPHDDDQRGGWVCHVDSFVTLIFRPSPKATTRTRSPSRTGPSDSALPELAVDEDLSGRREVGPGRSDLADHAFAPGDGAAGLGPDDQGDQEDADERDPDGHGDDEPQARPQLGNGGIDEHHGSDEHGDDTSDRERAVAVDLDLQDEEGDGQDDEEEAHVVDGEDLEREDGQEQGDPAQDARQDGSGIREFEIEAEEAYHQQDIGEIGVGDGQQEPLPEAHRDLDDGLAREDERRLPAAEPLEDLPVEGGKEVPVAFRDEVDEPPVQGLFLGVGQALADRVLGHGDVPAALGGQGLDVGGRVVRDLVFHRLVHGLAGDRDPHRVGRPGAGSRGHGEDVAGDPDEEPGRSRPRPAGTDMDGDGDLGVDDGLDDLAHRAVEPSRRVEADDEKAGADPFRVADGADDIFGGDGVDGRVDDDLPDLGRGDRRRQNDEKKDPDSPAHR